MNTFLEGLLRFGHELEEQKSAFLGLGVLYIFFILFLPSWGASPVPYVVSDL